MSLRCLRSLERLPMPGVFLHGPRWRRAFEVRAVAEALQISGRRAVSTMLVYDLEADVRERVLEELRPDVIAMWTDPREQLGLSATAPSSASIRPGTRRAEAWGMPRHADNSGLSGARPVAGSRG